MTKDHLINRLQGALQMAFLDHDEHAHFERLRRRSNNKLYKCRVKTICRVCRSWLPLIGKEPQKEDKQ